MPTQAHVQQPMQQQVIQGQSQQPLADQQQQQQQMHMQHVRRKLKFSNSFIFLEIWHFSSKFNGKLWHYRRIEVVLSSVKLKRK